MYTLTWRGEGRSLLISVFGCPPAGFLLEDVLREARRSPGGSLDVRFDLAGADPSILDEVAAIREALAPPLAAAA
jgi:hypothetical protein